MATRRSCLTRSHATTNSCPANSSRLSSKTCARRRPENDSPQSRSLATRHLVVESLRQQILRRDGWRCQSCGAMSNLEVHHRELRSQSGDDSEQNLITLCTACHSIVHRGSHSTARSNRADDSKG